MDKLKRNEIIFKILDFLGWIWWFVKKPFVWFGKQNWKVKTIIIILLLT